MCLWQCFKYQCLIEASYLPLSNLSKFLVDTTLIFADIFCWYNCPIFHKTTSNPGGYFVNTIVQSWQIFCKLSSDLSGFFVNSIIYCPILHVFPLETNIQSWRIFVDTIVQSWWMQRKMQIDNLTFFTAAKSEAVEQSEKLNSYFT